MKQLAVSVSASSVQTKTQKFEAPDVAKLKKMKELYGNYNLVKFKNPELKSKFKGMDVCDWFNLEGEPALIVGIYIPTHAQGDLRFAQANSKTEYANIVNKVSKFSRRGFASIELHVGTNHILVLTYAA